jgi:phosphate transport system ATP-binding protein
MSAVMTVETEDNGIEAANAPVKLALRNLEFFYGKHRALHGISFEVPPNSVTALIGPSGCGKSTLLRTINRIYELYPDQKATGEILLDGENVLNSSYSLSKLRSKVGMVFQKPTPFSLSIFENIAFPLRHYERLSKAEVRQRVESALTQAALWDEVKDKLDRSALALSGGQQQRLCIARTLVVKPEIVLLDEPTSALDPVSTAKIEQLVTEQTANFTFIIVTHNLQQAARIADRTAFMLDGDLVEVGARDQIFITPRDERTKAYVTGRFG